MCRAWSVTALAAATIAVASNVLGQDQTVGVVVRVHTVGHMPGDVLHDARGTRDTDLRRDRRTASVGQ